MATNIVHEHGDQLRVVCTAPASPSAGDPVLVGQIPGVALTDEDASGYTTVKFNGCATLDVKGETTTNAAVSVGDILYYDSGVINKDSSNGVRFGYALGAVESGATTSILVKIGY
jgi:predicted RecA/RadA family phage recombinase